MLDSVLYNLAIVKEAEVGSEVVVALCGADCATQIGNRLDKG